MKSLPSIWEHCGFSLGCHPSLAVWVEWVNCEVHWYDQCGQGLSSGGSICPSHLFWGCCPNDEWHCCQPIWKQDPFAYIIDRFKASISFSFMLFKNPILWQKNELRLSLPKAVIDVLSSKHPTFQVKGLASPKF